jgi:hypothetical protein
MTDLLLLLILGATLGELSIVLLSRGRPAAWRRRVFRPVRGDTDDAKLLPF